MASESGVLEEYYDVLSAETAAELERTVSDRRTRRSNDQGRRDRARRIADALD